MIKVSVIVPIYNVEIYLRECLDSLINQSLKEIEIICVNDGSTDTSLDILREYAVRDKRIKIISKNNTGYGNTMNIGIDNANGEYIGIVEPDDYVKADMYETLYNLAKENELDLIKADFYRFIGEVPNRKFIYVNMNNNKKYYNKVINPRNNIEIFKFVMNTWSGIYKKTFLKTNNIRHNETPGASFQDNGFWFQTFCWAQKVYFLDKPFYMNRRDNPNSSVKNKEKVYAAANEYKYIYNFLNAHPTLKEKFIYIYSLKKFHNYKFTMQRIAPEFHMEFLRYFAHDFNKMQSDREIDKKYFTKDEWEELILLLESPENYYKRYYKRNKLLKLKDSLYKTLYSIEENGISYTINKIRERLM